MSLCTQYRLKHRKKRQGSLFIEMPIGLLLMIVLVALAADVTLVFYGMALCDAACRDTARAAGQRNNASAAWSAALAEVDMHKTDGIFVSQPTLVSQSTPYFVYQDYGAAGPPAVNLSPYVTVTVSVNVKLPIPISFYGATFLPDGHFQFTRTYTYPIIKEKYYPPSP